MSDDLRPAIEARPYVLDVPADYEARTLDAVVGAIDDIAECDDSEIYIKWEYRPGPPHPVPILHICFSRVVAPGKLPMVHIDNDGIKRPAHSMCLAKIPSGRLLDTDGIKTIARRAVEQYLTSHGIRLTPARWTNQPVAFRPLSP